MSRPSGLYWMQRLNRQMADPKTGQNGDGADRELDITTVIKGGDAKCVVLHFKFGEEKPYKLQLMTLAESLELMEVYRKRKGRCEVYKLGDQVGGFG